MDVAVVLEITAKVMQDIHAPQGYHQSQRQHNCILDGTECRP
jgi:hypothetical protein